MSRDGHRDQLILDFKQPDNEDRHNGAVMRLAFYYPDVLEDLVIRQLRVPTFDVFAAEKFVREVLYKLKTPALRKEKLDAYLSANNPAAKEGLLRELFSDLDSQIADEEGRLSPPLKGKYDARNVLTQLFGFKKSVTPKDAPTEKTWSESEKARFIESLGPAQLRCLYKNSLRTLGHSLRKKGSGVDR